MQIFRKLIDIHGRTIGLIDALAADIHCNVESPRIGIVRSDVAHPMIVTIGQPIHASLGSVKPSVDDRKVRGGDLEIANQNSHLSTLQI
jgi:hypothetical protein